MKVNTSVFLFVLLIFASVVFSDDFSIPEQNMVNLKSDEQKTIELRAVADRINIGGKDVITLFMTDERTLIIHGKKPGFAILTVQYSDGKIEQYGVQVAPSLELVLLAQELRKNLKSFKDITIKQEAEKIIIAGQINDKEGKKYFDQIVSMYKDVVIDMVNIPDEAEKKHLVQVDVQVVQVRKDDSSQLGIQWFSSGPWSIGISGKAGLEDSNETGRDTTESIKNKSISEIDVSRSRSWSRSTGYSAGASLDNITFELIALVDKGKARFLATPKLIVQSGKTASFLVGGEIPIAQLTAMASSVDWKKYGTQLEIAPVVKDGNDIFINLKATVSELDYTHMVGNYPAILTKEAQSELTVRDGMTFAIAGLLSRDEINTISKVPVFGDIPGLRWLFAKRRKQIINTETIVFITPHIIKEGPVVATSFSSGIAPSKEVEKTILEVE